MRREERQLVRYRAMLRHYPNALTLSQIQEMLGIGRRMTYGLLRSGRHTAILNLYDEAGKRRQKSIALGIPVKGNKRKAQAQLEELKRAYSLGLPQEGKTGQESPLFADFLQDWLEITAPTIERTTYQSYRGLIAARLDPFFRALGLRLRELEPKHIRELHRIEVLGIRWSAIDDEKGTLSINHKVTEGVVDGRHQIYTEDRLKTKSSFRTLPPVPAVRALLDEQRARQEEYRRLFKKPCCTDYLDYVCTDESGRWTRPGCAPISWNGGRAVRICSQFTRHRSCAATAVPRSTTGWTPEKSRD